MEIRYSSKFRREYKKLDQKTKGKAKEKVSWFRQDPSDKRLDTHKLKGGLEGFWSFFLDNKHRIIFEFRSKNEAWFHLVGDHYIYKLCD